MKSGHERAHPEHQHTNTGPSGEHAGHADHRAPTGHSPHDKHAGHSVAMFRDKFWLTLLLTLPTLVWGHMLQRALGYMAPHFPGSELIPAVFGTAVFAYGGWPFLLGARREIADRLPGMMTLIALAITVAFVFSAAVFLGFPGMPLWEELATLVTIMLLGHWLEMRSISQAQGALGELAKLLPATAVRVHGAGAEEHIEEVRVDGIEIPQVRLGTAEVEGDYIRFFEQAFEWQNLTYVFYPYFWGRKSKWAARVNYTDADPLFEAFLKAGAARVVVPVRPGFETALDHYMSTGETWNGGELPAIGSDDYVPILVEISEQLGAPGNEVAQGEPWEVVIPTSLVKLRADGSLPSWHKDADGAWQPDA